MKAVFASVAAAAADATTNNRSLASERIAVVDCARNGTALFNRPLGGSDGDSYELQREKELAHKRTLGAAYRSLGARCGQVQFVQWQAS